MGLSRNPPPDGAVVNQFIDQIDFILPNGFLNFFENSNGGNISNDDNYVSIWPLSDLVDLNQGYEIDEFAPNFFLFGSEGGGEMAFAIERSSGHIFEMPFMGMDNDAASLFCQTFDQFLKIYDSGEES